MSAQGQTLRIYSASVPTFVRFGLKATVWGMGTEGREVPISDIGPNISDGGDATHFVW